MKFNKLYMALGVAALALTSCSDEEDYTPAPAVVTPEAYFNISDSKEVDLEKNSTEFSFPIYRAEAGGAYSPQLAIEIVSGDGVSSATAPFTPLNSDADPIFAEGATTGAIKYAVDMDQITALNDYSFLIKAEGESTPYFITSTEFVVSYVPWIDMGDASTGMATLIENGIWGMVSWSSGKKGLEMTLDVVVEKHPNEPIFRVTHPYLNAPGVMNSTTEEEFGAYTLDPNDPNYLYLNVENPKAVFFCDRRGACSQEYNTGVRYALEEGGWNEIGEVKIINLYWYSLNGKKYWINDESYIKDEFYAAAKGTYSNGVIEFGEGGVWFASMNVADYIWDGTSWVLKLPGAAQLGWASLGVGSMTDGFILPYWGEPVATWPVNLKESEETPGLFRVENPYRYGNGYPAADASTDVAGDGPWNIVIDCTDPNFVVVEPQATGFKVGTEQIIANAAGYYTTTDDATQKLSKDQIIANGWNDTYDAATRTITINHPMLSGDNGATWSKVWESAGFEAAKVVLPTEGAQAAPGKLVSRKISFAKSRTVNKIARR